ncbi:MAG TPA: response regulator transcription factor [Candidatus Binatia bacterium]|nr:response regulator transcription factor [Candidatus Binatia bacterium]
MAVTMVFRTESTVRRIRILVVASDPTAREAELAALRAMPDVELVGAASGASDALRKSSRRRPDLVLMDLLMPRQSGLQIGATLKRRPGAPRVVLVSLGGDVSYARAANEFGIDAVLPRDDLAGALPSLLSRLFPSRTGDVEPPAPAPAPAPSPRAPRARGGC